MIRTSVVSIVFIRIVTVIVVLFFRSGVTMVSGFCRGRGWDGGLKSTLCRNRSMQYT